MSRLDYLSDTFGERLKSAILYNPYIPHGVDITNSLSILNYLSLCVPANKIQWVVMRLIDRTIRLEDMDRVHDAIQLFDRIKNRLPSKDINSYRSLADLEDALYLLDDQQVLSNKQKAKLTKLEGAEYVIDTHDFKVLHIKTSSAAQLYGCGTRWCTAARSNNIFDYYNRQGPLYIILVQDRKFQLHYQTEQFMDEKDTPVTSKDKAFLSSFSQWKDFLDLIIEQYYGMHFT